MSYIIDFGDSTFHDRILERRPKGKRAKRQKFYDQVRRLRKLRPRRGDYKTTVCTVHTVGSAFMVTYGDWHEIVPNGYDIGQKVWEKLTAIKDTK